MAIKVTAKAISDAIEKKIGYGPFAKHIIIEALKGYNEPEGKYHEGAIDRLDELKGIDGFWEKRDSVDGKVDEAKTDAEKIKMIDEAIAAIKAL